MPGRPDDAELAKMLGLTDDQDGGAATKPRTGGSPQTLGNPPMPMGLSRKVWLIAALVVVFAIAFFMAVANLGGSSA